MGLVERIKIIFDVDDAPGVRGLKSIRTEMAAAEGATGKFKAGWSGATDMVKENAGALALAGGAALVAFGAKAVESYTKGAMQAGKFSEATGLAVDDSSRLIEVASDLGVSMESVQGAAIKFNTAVAAGNPILDEYGIKIVRAKDGTADAAKTFEQAISSVGAIEDPFKRAEAARALFGKGFASMSELMSMSAEQLQQRLADVASGQVFDDSDVAKARELRDAIDNLKDRAEGFVNTVGEKLVPVLISAADTLDGVAAGAGKVSNAFKTVTGIPLVGWLRSGLDLLNGWDNAQRGFNKMTDSNSSALERFAGGIDTVLGGIPIIGTQVDWLTHKIFPDVTATLDDSTKALIASRKATDEQAAAARASGADIVIGEGALRDLEHAAVDYTEQAAAEKKQEDALSEARREATGRQKSATEAAKERLDAERDLAGQLLSQVDAQRAYETAVDNGESAVADFNATAADTSSTLEDIDDAARGAADTLISQAQAFATSKGAADNSRESIRLQIDELYGLAAAMDPKSPLRARLIAYIGELQSIPSTIDTMLKLNISSGATVTKGGDFIGGGYGTSKGPRADGGTTAAGSRYSVLERGAPEVYTDDTGRTWLMTGDGNGNVTPVAPGGSGGTGDLTINTSISMAGATIVGVADLEQQIGRMIDERDRRLLATLKAGRR